MREACGDFKIYSKIRPVVCSCVSEDFGSSNGDFSHEGNRIEDHYSKDVEKKMRDLF